MAVWKANFIIFKGFNLFPAKGIHKKTLFTFSNHTAKPLLLSQCVTLIISLALVVAVADNLLPISLERPCKALNMCTFQTCEGDLISM